MNDKNTALQIDGDSDVRNYGGDSLSNLHDASVAPRPVQRDVESAGCVVSTTSVDRHGVVKTCSRHHSDV